MSSAVSLAVLMLNVIGPAAAPLAARLSVHVSTATALAGRAAVPSVTVRTAPTVAPPPPPVAIAMSLPPLVIVHAVAVSLVKMFTLGVIVTVAPPLT